MIQNFIPQDRLGYTAVINSFGISEAYINKGVSLAHSARPLQVGYVGSAASHPQIWAERDINYSSEGKGDRVDRTETFQACIYISLVKEDLHCYANLKQGQRNITLSYAPKDEIPNIWELF